MNVLRQSVKTELCILHEYLYIYISWIFILNWIYYIINWIYKDVTEWLDEPLGKKKTASTRLCQYVVGAQETFLSSRPYFCHGGFVFYLILILWLLWWECSTDRTWGMGGRVSKATLVRWDNFVMMCVHFLNVFAALMVDNKILLPWLNYFAAFGENTEIENVHILFRLLLIFILAFTKFDSWE